MPAAASMDTEIGVIYVIAQGYTRLSELGQLARRPELLPGNRPPMKFIVDYRDADIEVDSQSMHDMVSYIRDVRDRGFDLEPTAFLTYDRVMATFLGAVDLMADQPSEIRQVFESLEEGVHWLGLDAHRQPIERLHAELCQQLRSRPESARLSPTV